MRHSKNQGDLFLGLPSRMAAAKLTARWAASEVPMKQPIPLVAGDDVEMI
jgi:hypothetical protein